MTQPHHDRVIVGTDGSAASKRAIELGAAEAHRRGVGLTLLHALSTSTPLGPASLLDAMFRLNELPDIIASLTRTATEELEQVAGELRQTHPGIDVTVTVVAGPPAAVLIDASHDAELVVLGCRGLGGFEELLLGSVSSQVAAHAHSPVIVVRPHDHDSTNWPSAPIVVGVDGSDANRPAVEFAFVAADRQDRELIALNCWAPSAGLLQDYSVEDLDTDEVSAAAMLTDAVAAWQERYPAVRVTKRSMRHGYAESALIDASAEASLIVVGSRGRGGFAGLLLGSVSQALLHHGHCPVAVIHAD